MYDVMNMDIWSTPSSVTRLGPRVRLPDPKTEFDSSYDFAALGVPPYIVLNWSGPTYAPANPIWGASRSDGPSICLCFYLKLNAVGKKAIQDRTPAGNLLKVHPVSLPLFPSRSSSLFLFLFLFISLCVLCHFVLLLFPFICPSFRFFLRDILFVHSFFFARTRMQLVCVSHISARFSFLIFFLVFCFLCAIVRQ